MKKADIEAFVARHAGWVAKKLDANEARLAACAPKQFADGEEFFCLGETFRLRIEAAKKGGVVREEGSLRVFVPARLDAEGQTQRVRKELEGWYRVAAAQCLADRIRARCAQVGAQPAQVKGRAFKSRWGSCTASGAVAFNWRLVMAPPQIADYVVVHELCHLLHQDHSPRFWREVERVLPDFGQSRRWLRANGHRLSW